MVVQDTFSEFWAGFGVVPSFFFVLPTPPIGTGGVLGNFATPTVVQDYSYEVRMCFFFSPFRWYNFASTPLAAIVALLWAFAFPSTRFRSALPLPGDMAVFFIDVFSPLRIGLLSLLFLLGVPCRLRNLAVQRCGSGF